MKLLKTLLIAPMICACTAALTPKPASADTRQMDALTLATALKDNGYHTGHVGKWHLGLSSSLFGFEFSHEDRGVHRKTADRTKDFATADDPKYPLSQIKVFEDEHFG